MQLYCLGSTKMVSTHTEVLNGQALSIIQCTLGEIDPHYTSHRTLSTYVRKCDVKNVMTK